MRNEIDHVTVGAADLESGAADMRRLLGIDMPAGGKHADMATHNRLMRTTDGEFLELLAIDPEAPARAVARECLDYLLDKVRGTPRLGPWGRRLAALPLRLARRWLGR
jgi:hypothetical protein